MKEKENTQRVDNSEESEDDISLNGDSHEAKSKSHILDKLSC